MSKTRAQLLYIVQNIEEQIPDLLRQQPTPEGFWDVFSGLVAEAMEAAGNESGEWMADRIDALLHFYRAPSLPRDSR